MTYFDCALYSRSIDPKDRENEPSIADPFFGRKLTGVKVSTTTAGFAALTGSIACDRLTAQRYRNRRLGRHVVAWSRGRRVFEGRLERVVPTDTGVTIENYGYYNSLDDVPFAEGKLGKKVDVATIAGLTIDKYAPLLSGVKEHIQSTGYRLALDTYDGSETPKQVLEASLQTSKSLDPTPFFAMIWEGRRLWVVPQERRYVSWTIPARSLSADPSPARDLQDLYCAVNVIYEVVTTRNDGSERRTKKTYSSPDDEAILATLGFSRRLILSGNKDVDSAEAAATYAKAQLRQWRNGLAQFSLQVSGRVRDHVGAAVEPQFIRAGTIGRLDSAPLDEGVLDDAGRLFWISQADWDRDSGKVTLTCDPFDADLELPGTKVVFASSGLVKVPA